jgi:DNA-binding transcriptional regulator YiaG
MEKNADIPRIPYRRAIYCGKNGEVYFNLSGEMGSGLARIYAPPSEVIRAMLLRLRRRQNWSQSTLAAVLGVTKHAVRRWEDRSRQPGRSSKKLIWLVYALFFNPKELLKDLDNLVTWGQGREEILVLDEEDPSSVAAPDDVQRGSEPFQPS